MREEPFAREFDAIASSAAERKRVLVLGHVDPDGDCIGSMLALSNYLIGLGSEVACFTPGAMAELYRALPLSRLFVPEERLASLDPNLVFVLDSPTTARTANLIRHGSGALAVNIDHHPTNERFGDINVIDETVSAAAILVYRLLDRVAPGALTPETADYLYLGVLMDTGGFRFRNTNAEALAAALGAGWCFLVNALTFLAVIAGLLLMHLPKFHKPIIQPKMNAHLKEGWRYLAQHPDGPHKAEVEKLIQDMSGEYFLFIKKMLASCEQNMDWKGCVELSENFIRPFATLILPQDPSSGWPQAMASRELPAPDRSRWKPDLSKTGLGCQEWPFIKAGVEWSPVTTRTAGVSSRTSGSH